MNTKIELRLGLSVLSFSDGGLVIFERDAQTGYHNLVHFSREDVATLVKFLKEETRNQLQQS